MLLEIASVTRVAATRAGGRLRRAKTRRSLRQDGGGRVLISYSRKRGPCPEMPRAVNSKSAQACSLKLRPHTLAPPDCSSGHRGRWRSLWRWPSSVSALSLGSTTPTLETSRCCHRQANLLGQIANIELLRGNVDGALRFSARGAQNRSCQSAPPWLRQRPRKSRRSSRAQTGISCSTHLRASFPHQTTLASGMCISQSHRRRTCFVETCARWVAGISN
jgi:hypothetical protein